MKGLASIRTGVMVFVAMFYATVYTACKKDENERGGASKVSVERVSLHNATVLDSAVTQARLGTILRLEGQGFNGTRQIFLNGVKISVNPGYVTENKIIFQIPSTLPFGRDVSDSVRNTIRIITNTDDFSYKFTIQGSLPVISSVSHTLPREGEVIEIYGQNLRDLTSLTFPGGISVSSDNFTVDGTHTVLTCIVPEGATATPGAIRVNGDNGSANSYNYMNRRKGIFISNFTGDPSAPGVSPCNSRPYNYGTNVSATFSAMLPLSGTGPKNPQFYRQVPAAPANIPVENNAGGFDFYSCSALNAALASADGAFTESTPINNLAIQFDIYIPVSWSSGLIRLDMLNGDSKFRFDYAPWATGAGVVAPVVMDGWRTVTVPLSVMTGLSGGKTYRDFITAVSGKGGSIRFINGTFRDSGGTGYPPSVINNFQYSFGNFRVVPYQKPAL